ncbi:MAG: GNAT family N-acetyltransferase [Candidatus Thorarchaeota archaeon]
MKELQELYQIMNIPLNKGAEVISKAFHDDPLYAYIIPDESDRIKYFPYIFKAYIWYCLHFGEVYASSSNLEGIALWVPSEFAYITPERSKKCGDEVFFYVLGKKYLERLSVTAHPNKVHEELMKEPHIYLMVIAVDPEFQRKGYGKKLLLPMMKRLDQNNQKCYLDTNKQSNVPYYQNFGFQLLKEFEIKNTGVTNWSMLRVPKD